MPVSETLSRAKKFVFLGLVALTTLVAFRAEASGDVAAAQALFDEAKKLVARGEHAAACSKFAESQRLDPSAGTLLHLAACHESEGKTATAWSEFSEALSLARRDGRADREAFAKSRIADLEAKLVMLTVLVSDAARTSGLELKRDGRVLREAEWGVAVPVDPGEHTVEAQASGRAKWSRRVLVNGSTGNVSVNVPELAPEPSAPAATPVAQAPQGPAAPRDTGAPEPGSGRRTAGLLVGALGLAALGVGTVFEIQALSKASERDDAAGNGDAAGTARLHDEAKSAELTGFVVGAAGIAALGTGVVLYVTAPSPSATSGVRIAPRVASNGVSLSLEGRFR